jgi:ankyrin repeat protein
VFASGGEHCGARPFQKEKAMNKVLVSIFSLAVVLSLSHAAASQAGSGSLNDQLLQAADKGNVAAVQQLLGQGANIEARQEVSGGTALIRASMMGYIAVVRLLLAKGANIEARDKNGDTALTLAAMMGLDDVVKLLLDRGANMDAKNNNGQTALAMAESVMRDSTAKLLREHGAH